MSFEIIKQAYDELQPPHTARFSTSPEETQEIGRLRDEYFDRVVATLKLSQRAIETFLSIEYRTLCVEEPAGPLRVSDDFDGTLWLSGVQPLASVRNIRDTHNHQVIIYAKYPFAETTEMALRNIYDLQSGSGLVKNWP